MPFATSARFSGTILIRSCAAYITRLDTVGIRHHDHDPEADRSDKSHVFLHLACKLSHQWWGDLCLALYRDQWLSEGFATIRVCFTHKTRQDFSEKDLIKPGARQS